MRKVCDDDAVVDTKVDLNTNDPSETHRRSLILGDVGGISTSILVMSFDEVEGAEEVAIFQLLVELVSVGYAEHEKNVETSIKQHHSHEIRVLVGTAVDRSIETSKRSKTPILPLLKWKPATQRLR